MRGRGRHRRGIKHPHGWRIADFGGSDQHILRARRGGGDIARHTFVQQQLNALDHRFGVKPIAQAAILQRVGDGGDRHALMMRHETAHDGVVAFLGNAGGGEIDRFVKAVAPSAPRLQAGR